MDTAIQLHAILSRLPSVTEAEKLTKQRLRDVAASLGLSTTGCRTKHDLIEVVCVPSQGLRCLHGVEFEWEVACERSSDAFVRWRESHLLVRIDDSGIAVEPGDPDRRHELLAASLQRCRDEIVDVSAEGIELDRLLELLDTYLVDPDMEIHDREHGVLQSWQLEDGTVAWIPEEAWWERPGLFASHYDLIGQGTPSPASGTPGTVMGTRHRGYLLCVDLGAEEKHIARLATACLDAQSLLAALGLFFEFVVSTATYSLDINADLDADEVRRLLEPARGVGGLWVGGHWWYETPTGWSDAALEPLAPPTLDPDGIAAIHLAWLYPAYDGTVDLVLFDEPDPSLRMALTTLAAHKANGWEREAAAWVEVELADGEMLMGVALRNAHRIDSVAGVEPCLEVNLETCQVLLRAPDGGLAQLELDHTESEEPPFKPFWDAIEWLRTRSGPYPPVSKPEALSQSSDAETRDGSADAGDRPAPLSPPSAHPHPVVSDLEPGYRGYVFRRAVAMGPDGRLWIDPEARVRPAGLPATDPTVWIDEAGTAVIDTQDLGEPLLQREARHSMPARNLAP